MNFSEFFQANKDNANIYDRQVCPGMLVEFFGISNYEAIRLYGQFSNWLDRTIKKEPCELVYVDPDFGDVAYPDYS